LYTSVVNNLAVVAGLPAVINTMQPPTASAVAAPPPGEPFNDTSAPHSPVAPPVPSHRGQDGALGYGNRHSGRYGPVHQWRRKPVSIAERPRR
jgi:hypothetical protein